MELRLLSSKLAAACLALALAGCLSPSQPVELSPDSGGSSGGSSSTSTTTKASLEAFKDAKAVKVIFNKSSFYNNDSPNALGCAGDARYYYDPISDRQIPTKPDWLLNVGTDITNSNAQDGPSRAIACSLTGSGAPVAANCATFDDLQPLSGATSRSILVGGYGCAIASSTCTATSMLSDIWNLHVPDLSTGASWVNQPGQLPAITAGNAAGLLWMSGDYDELHDSFYLYGGVTPNTALANSTVTFNSNILKITYNSDGTVNTSFPPAAITSTTIGPRIGGTLRPAYGGWAKGPVSNTLTAPAARAGATFTYGLRRDPAFKAWCNPNDTTFTDCSSGSTNTSTAYNEHHDYYLLVGGMESTGFFSSMVHFFSPHGFSNDVPLNAPSGGSWTQMSNEAGQASIMALTDIATSSSSTNPFTATTSAAWLPRAYHRAVYDPGMNRFYIFGGLTIAAATDASGTVPDVSTDLWIYDPPSYDRRPNAACFTTVTPDNTAIPLAPTAASNALMSEAATFDGVLTSLDANRKYLSSNIIFPPGGCLQRIVDVATAEWPTKRFEHAMAFDRDHKAMMVFGGCNTPSTIVKANATNTADPLTNCNNSASLLRDTWIYLPPVVQEIVPKTYTTTTQPHPYDSTDDNTKPLANIFGTDFWLDHFPLYTNNDPDQGKMIQPRTDQVLGTWISLTQTTRPTPRASASLVYDRAHKKYYLQGGWGCTDSSCSNAPQVLNDLWEFTPPNIETECSRTSKTCTNQGTWKLLRASDIANTSQPTTRKGGLMAYGNPMVSYGDEYYTVTDSACISQGPIVSGDSSINKQYVGAIYIDIDRNEFSNNENLLINLRMMPFDDGTKLPAWSENSTPNTTSDDTDQSSSNDQAVVRVQFLNSALKFTDQIQATIQPRYHEFIAGTPVISDTHVYVSGASGQLTDKQILVPLKALDSTVNLIKIERVQGSVKFYELTLSKF